MLKKIFYTFIFFIIIDLLIYTFILDSPQQASRSISLLDILELERRTVLDTEEDHEGRKAWIEANVAAEIKKRVNIDITKSIYSILQNEKFHLHETEQKSLPGTFRYRMEFTNRNGENNSIIFSGPKKGIEHAKSSSVSIVAYEDGNGSKISTHVGPYIAYYVYGINDKKCIDIISKIYSMNLKSYRKVYRFF